MVQEIGLTASLATPRPHAIGADQARARWLAAQSWARWQRRGLPLLGAASLLFVWWALVAVFEVKPYVAPSPEVVARDDGAEIQCSAGQSSGRR